jgi:hypothetical protein
MRIVCRRLCSGRQFYPSRFAESAVFTHSVLGRQAGLAAFPSRRLGFDASGKGELAYASLVAALAENLVDLSFFESRVESVASNSRIGPNGEMLKAFRDL